jgi:hypothetical protein
MTILAPQWTESTEGFMALAANRRSFDFVWRERAPNFAQDDILAG